MPLRNIEFTLENTNSTHIDAIFSSDIGGSLISPQETELYNVAISRLKIPVDNVDIINVLESDENFYLKYALPYKSTDVNDLQTGYIKTYLISSAKYPIYRPSNMIQNVNKALAKLHYDLNMSHPSMNNIHDSSQNFTFDTTSVPTYSKTYTINVSNPLVKTSSIYLKLFNIDYVDEEENIINIHLVNPDGDKVCIMNGIKLQKGKTYEFADHFINDYSQKNNDYTLPINNGSSNCQYAPLNSFLDFSEKGTNGNWNLIISNSYDSVCYLEMSAQLVITAPPYIEDRFICPYVPLTLEIDTSTGYISYRAQNLYLRSGIVLDVGDYLLNIMQISTNNKNGNNIIFPANVSLQSNTDIDIIPAEIARMAQCSHIESVYATSPQLSIERDITNKRYQLSDIITIFSVDNSQINNIDSLDLTLSNIWRRYRLKYSDIRFLDIKLYVKYRDGSSKILQVPPRTVAQLTLSFFDRRDNF